ncbi:MAG: hypothetical protein AB8H12_06955 [Lewinella sp.]
MRPLSTTLSSSTLLVLLFLLLPSISSKPPDTGAGQHPLRPAAFRILDAKCNGCHRKKNPFMVFKTKNMDKRAKRIYRAVYVQRRMPKADGTPLTAAESDSLRRWLQTQIHKQ